MINNSERRIIEYSSKIAHGRFYEITFAKHYDDAGKDKYEIVWIEDGKNTLVERFDEYAKAKDRWDVILKGFNVVS